MNKSKAEDSEYGNAVTHQVHSKSNQTLQLVTFRLGNEEYGVNILKVREVNRMVNITSVPNAENYIEGVINLRGKVIPVVNLRKRFGLEFREIDSQSRIMVVDVGTTVGLIVDSVSEVLRVSSDIVEPPPPMAAGNDSAYVLGVGKLDKGLLMLLDIEKLLGEGIGKTTAPMSVN
ncbi:MAG TPA: chemotaxis protein CheW [Thermodesulfovibrionales bacterium]|nr:chemotaxis protein CheW [Thermodesulfovibrionales bacterium]